MKKDILKVLRSTVRMNLLLWNCKEGKRNPCYFWCRTSNYKIPATVCDMCLVKMEKALNFYNKIFLERESKREITFT